MYQRILGAVLLIICSALAVSAWGYQAPFSYEPVGPRAYPLLLLVLIMVGACYLALGPVPAPAKQPAAGDEDMPLDRPMLIKVSSCVALMLAYAAAFESLGFLLATTAFGASVAWLYGGRLWQSALLGVVASAGLYLLFDKALDVPLPLGLLAAQGN